MAALMGPSGSGKSTLLDLLSGRKTVGELQGKIAFAGAAGSGRRRAGLASTQLAGRRC